MGESQLRTARIAYLQQVPPPAVSVESAGQGGRGGQSGEAVG